MLQHQDKQHDHELAPGVVQAVFVGALLLVVLSAIAEYMLGDFRGHSAGGDFGLFAGLALAAALVIGFVLAVFHRKFPKDH